MAVASSSSAAYALPTLKYYFSPTTFHDLPRPSSRPSSSSSNSSYGAPTYPQAPLSASSYFALKSDSPDNTNAPTSSPSHDNTIRMSRLNRPLPTPPATPLSAQSTLASPPPRPLPRPPVHRAQSYQSLRSDPLPSPPHSAPLTFPEHPLPSSSKPSATDPKGKASAHPYAFPSAFAPSHPPRPSSTTLAERPSIRLEIPPARARAPAPHKAITPLSPIAFNIPPGPRDVRKRREAELERRMAALGFVESPRTPKDEPSSTRACKSPPSAHERSFSMSSAVSDGDDERDVVLLVDCSSDAEGGEHPTRSESRQAMLTLFADDADGDEECDGESDAGRLSRIAEAEMGRGGARTPVIEVQVDVKVEIVTKQAAARTKRRFSRKWVRERKGKRYTEQDFSGIISELRKLR